MDEDEVVHVRDQKRAAKEVHRRGRFDDEVRRQGDHKRPKPRKPRFTEFLDES